MSQGLRVDIEVRLPTFGLRATFDVPPGLTVLFGPSGAGKSLTLQTIAGLVAPARGRIALGEETIYDSARHVALPPRLRHLGYVPQQYALFPHLNVAENVAYALPRASRPRHPWDQAAAARRSARVAELLALVRLPGFENRRPRQLSGGQAQRVALARALAARPRALLLDEPLGALDAPTRAAVRDDLRTVVLESGVPAIVVTHDLAEARALGDRLVVLTGGTIAASGPLADVLASPTTDESALLLGWRNVLPVADVARRDDRATVTLVGGHRLDLTLDPIPTARVDLDPLSGVALALHADRLEPVRAASGTQYGAPPQDVQQALSGAVRSVEDAGAYYLVRIALTGDRPGTPPSPVLVVTCSHREWAALGATVGDPITLRVPPGAARLVTTTGVSQDAGRAHAPGEVDDGDG